MGTPHGGANKYYDPTTKVVYDAVTAEADDLNDINTAVDAAFGLVADDLDALALEIDSSLAENWASDPLGTNPDPLQPTKYSALANSEVAEEWAIGTPIDQDGVPTGDLSAKAEALAAAADVVLTHADVVLTGLDVDATNADVVLTHADVVLTGLDVDSTNADVVLTHADVVLTGLDAIDTAQDSVDTNADKLAVEALYDEFDDRYLGAKASAPTVDNDGNALITGALYWNSTTDDMWVWTGAAWSLTYAPSALFVAQTSATGSAELPKGTTAERDIGLSSGYLRFNTDTGLQEVYNSSSWESIITDTPRRNLIINGSMRTNQRGVADGDAVASTDYTIDRFYQTFTGAVGPKVTVERGTEFSYVGFHCTSFVPSSTDSIQPVAQAIEGLNVQHLREGGTVTISFKARSTKAGIHVVKFNTDNTADSNRFILKEFTISLADAWEYFQIPITIPASYIGDELTEIGIKIAIGNLVTSGGPQEGLPDTWYTTANPYKSTAGAVNWANTTGASGRNEFAVAELQVEVGAVASPFEHMSVGEELALCQRYYYKSITTTDYLLFSGDVTNGSAYYGYRVFPVTMRSTPAIVGTAGTQNSFPSTVGSVSSNSGGFRESRVANASSVGHFTTSFTADAEL